MDFLGFCAHPKPSGLRHFCCYFAVSSKLTASRVRDGERNDPDLNHVREPSSRVRGGEIEGGGKAPLPCPPRPLA